MKQPITILAADDSLRGLEKKMNDLGTRTREKFMFLEKQAKTLFNEVNNEKKEIWDDVQAKLRVSGKLPTSYDVKKHYLQVENGVLYMKNLEQGQCNCGDTHEEPSQQEKTQIIKQVLSKIMGLNAAGPQGDDDYGPIIH